MKAARPQQARWHGAEGVPAHLAAPGVQPAPQRQAAEPRLVALERQGVLQRGLQQRPLMDGWSAAQPRRMDGLPCSLLRLRSQALAPGRRTCTSVDSATPDGARCLSVSSRLGSCCTIVDDLCWK
jgi:hypothetical protein